MPRTGHDYPWLIVAVTNDNLLGTGPIAFEYSAFSVDGRPDLGMVIYQPATPEDAERIRALLRSQTLPPASQTAVAAHERQ